jgi:hypothetical protein
MKKIFQHAAVLLLLSAVIHPPSTAYAQGTTFTYQGRLNAGGTPANGLYDYRFRLDADPEGNTILATVFTNAISVTNGLFMTTMDFGAGIFTGSNYWLEVDVRTNGATDYTTLAPLQALTPTPYAIFANGASNVLGVVANANLPASPTVSGVVSAGGFVGNGANLTNVNAATLNGLPASNFWNLSGNTVLPGQVVGSANNQPFEIVANNFQVYQASYSSNPLNGYSPNVINGFAGNFISNGIVGAAIGGGGSPNQGIVFPPGAGAYEDFDLEHAGTNAVWGDFGTVPGGFGNIAGGVGSLASGIYCTASGLDSFAMGAFNIASGNDSVALGSSAIAQANGSVAIGDSTFATGYGAVALGMSVQASASNSVALGYQAQAVNQGAFVWSDSETNSFASTANNQFLIRAQGGVGIGTNAPAGALHVASASGAPQIQVDQQNPDFARIRLHALTNALWDIAAQSALNLYSGAYGNVMTLQNNGLVGVSVANPVHYLDVGGRIRLRQEPGGATAGLWLYQNDVATDRAFIGLAGDGYVGFWGNVADNWGMVMNVTNNYVGIGNLTPTTYLQVVNATCNGSSWVNASDRNLKQNFAPVNPAEVLAKVVALPVQSWDYKAQPGDKHIGPVAQDFHAAFGLNGDDDKHIATVDESGVALAAIQGLNERLNEKDAEYQKLQAQNESLEKRLADLEQLVKASVLK